MKRITIAAFFSLASLAILTSCGSTSQQSNLSGAGATFPVPFYNIAFKGYTIKTGYNVTYGAIGSGGGARSLKDKTIDFGATDVFLSDNELTEFGADIVHIPTAMGAVVLSYNLKGVSNLKLTSELISDIYRGKITKWNDAKLVAINEGVALPDKSIIPVYRSDGSGTTAVFSDYMSKVNAAWNTELGKGKALKFTVGIAAKGNPGVAGIVAETDGAIGYIGSEYASALNMNAALLQNSAGNFVEANTKSISAAADVEMPADTRITITNSSNVEAYPIATFTWLIAYKEQNYNKRNVNLAKNLAALFTYIISAEGQEMAERTHYAALPASAQEKSKAVIASMTYEGNKLD